MSEFPELELLESCLDQCVRYGKVNIETVLFDKNCRLPIYSIELGSFNKNDPALAIIGGIHGIERIGSHVIIAFLKHLLEKIAWDDSLCEHLKHTRLLFYPIANPIGMLRQKRSNGNGVDLMRHAPVDNERENIFNLIAGHRISPRMPWYRGPKNEPLEQEAEVLLKFCKRELWPAKLAIALDVHSGFGFRDRLWFPYAKAKKPVQDLGRFYALRRLLRDTYPYHIYKIEPQCCSYTAQGDLWDYIYDQAISIEPRANVYPLCLEMGSWSWIKKNPKQIFSFEGLFNPIIEHRLERTLRRHILLFDFLHRAVRSPSVWWDLDSKVKDEYERRGLIKWYERS